MPGSAAEGAMSALSSDWKGGVPVYWWFVRTLRCMCYQSFVS